MITPADLELPDKFSAYRKGQGEAVIDIAASDKRFTLVSAPTGSGKSITYVSVARILGGRTLIVTGTKGLQGQLLADFAPIGMNDIRGMNNYKCIALDQGGMFWGKNMGSPGTMCNDAPCRSGVECDHREGGGCLYYDALKVARKAKLVVTNYRYWMTMNRYSEPDSLGRFDLLILDEAHSAPDELADFCSVRLEEDEVRRLISTTLPPVDEGVDSWVDWAKLALRECRIRRSQVEVAMPKTDYKRARLLKRYTDLENSLVVLAAAHQWRRSEPSIPTVRMPGMQTDWVAEKTHNGVAFSPVWAHPYAESYLFNNIQRVVLTSATLQPAVGRYLGIDSTKSEFKEYASTFLPTRRPLIHVPTTNVDRRMTDGQVRVWMNRIDAIITGRPNWKGIIHTRSYERAQHIYATSRHRGIMIAHGRSNAREVVARFKAAKAPCVLVSPVMEEGYDFPYDECRYQIIVKVPFVDTRSLITQARAASDKGYLNYLTALSLIQMVGRGMRAEDDSCETFIIDDHWDWFRPAADKMGLWPRWFKASFKRHPGVPKAMMERENAGGAN